jgi:hypothetical protein
MADLLKSFATGWSFLLAWIFPSGIVVGAWAVLILPRAEDSGLVVPAGWDATTKGVVVAFVTVTVGFLLAALSTPLYRVLEGYLAWPTWLRRRRTRSHVARKQRLMAAAQALPEDSLEAALAHEKADRYPAADAQVAPTQLGNALRAMETYAQDRYTLDSQRLWSELTASAPPAAVDANSAARTEVDFFVAMFHLTVLFSLATEAIVLAAWRRTGHFDLGVTIAGGAVLALLWLWYRGAVIGVSFWRSSTQAMVNLGRVELARSLGLELPKALAAERDMWQRVTSFVYFSAADNTDDTMLDAYRTAPAGADPHDSAPPQPSRWRPAAIGAAGGAAVAYVAVAALGRLAPRRRGR